MYLVGPDSYFFQCGGISIQTSTKESHLTQESSLNFNQAHARCSEAFQTLIKELS